MKDTTEPTRPWTSEQLGAFVEQVRHDRYAALWLLVATSGLPLDVLAGLQRREVDLNERRIHPQQHRSRSPSRAVEPHDGRGYGLDPTTYDVLRDHVIAWDKDRDHEHPNARHLFLRTDGRPVVPADVRTMFQVHCLRADVSIIPLRTVRETYVIDALRSGLPAEVLNDRLGHDVFDPTGRRPSPTHAHRASHLRSV